MLGDDSALRDGRARNDAPAATHADGCCAFGCCDFDCCDFDCCDCGTLSSGTLSSGTLCSGSGSAQAQAQLRLQLRLRLRLSSRAPPQPQARSAQASGTAQAQGSDQARRPSSSGSTHSPYTPLHASLAAQPAKLVETVAAHTRARHTCAARRAVSPAVPSPHSRPPRPRLGHREPQPSRLPSLRAARTRTMSARILQGVSGTSGFETCGTPSARGAVLQHAQVHVAALSAWRRKQCQKRDLRSDLNSPRPRAAQRQHLHV